MAEFLGAAWPYAAAVLVILGIVCLVLLAGILYRTYQTLQSVQTMVNDAEKQVSPALEKVNPLIDKTELLMDTVNIELLRVDSILENVGSITNVAGKAADTVDTVTSAPADAVTTLVDYLRDTFGIKRSNKLKESRVVYPVAAEEPASSAKAVKENEEAIAAAFKAEKPAQADADVVGKHSVKAADEA